MSVIKERPRQSAVASWTDPSSTREYAVAGCSTRDDALTLVSSTAPGIDTVGGVDRYIEKIEIKETGGGCWTAICYYSKNPDRADMTFGIGAGSFRAQQSKETIVVYDNGVDAPPDFARGVGYNGTSFDGVDVELPKMEIKLNKKYAHASIPSDYLVTLYTLAQTVNDAEFTLSWQFDATSSQTLTFPKGTLRYRGSSVKMDTDKNLDVTFDFLYQRGVVEADNIMIGDIGPIEKEGHQYLWVFYSPATVNGFLVKKPIGVYIERVYDYADFSQLVI